MQKEQRPKYASEALDTPPLRSFLGSQAISQPDALETVASSTNITCNTTQEFSSCAGSANVNNAGTLFLTFITDTEAQAFFTGAGGVVGSGDSVAVTLIPPGGMNFMTETNNPLILSIRDTPLPAGPFSGTLTSPSGDVCSFDGGGTGSI